MDFLGWICLVHEFLHTVGDVKDEVCRPPAYNGDCPWFCLSVVGS